MNFSSQASLPPEIWLKIFKKCAKKDIFNLALTNKHFNQLIVASIKNWHFHKKVQSLSHLKNWHCVSSYPSSVTFANQKVEINSWEDRFNFMESCVLFLNRSFHIYNFSAVDWVIQYTSEKMLGELIFFHPNIAKIPLCLLCLRPSLSEEIHSHFQLDGLEFVDAYSTLITKFYKHHCSTYPFGFLQIVEPLWGKILLENIQERDWFNTSSISDLIFFSNAISSNYPKHEFIEKFEKYDIPVDILGRIFHRTSEQGLETKTYIPGLFYYLESIGKLPVVIRIVYLTHAQLEIISSSTVIFSRSVSVCNLELVDDALAISNTHLGKPLLVCSDNQNDLKTAYEYLQEYKNRFCNPTKTSNPVHYMLNKRQQ